MTGFLRLAVLLAALVAGVGFILYQVARFAFAINNPAGLAKRDGSKLREIIAPYLDRLVPLTMGELELFSLNRDIKTIKKGRYTITSGVFTSIYHEPLLAYAYKEYKGRNVSTMIARTLDDEFFFISSQGETKVFYNGQAYGVITPEGGLYTPDKKQLVASISPEDVLKLHPVRIGEREVGSVLNPKYIESPNPRAFQFLEEMNPEDRKKFMALSILSIVEESLS